MGDNKITFQLVPESKANVRILGSLVFDKRDELGPSAFIDFTGLPGYLPLARDFIAALYEHSKQDRIGSEQSIFTYKRPILEILSYCRHLKVPDGFRMKDLTFDFLLEFRAHLKLSLLDKKSGTRRRYFGNILRLVEAGQAAGLVNQDLARPRNFAFIDDGDRTQPYTLGEALDFEDACRTHIRELRARLAKGKELLLVGKNPKGLKPERDAATGRIMKQSVSDRAWNQLPNLLWYVVHEMDGKYLQRSKLLSEGHSSFNNSVMGAFGGGYRKVDVYSHLYPLSTDLIPFIVLLAKKTGRNESSILTLNRNCLQEVNGRYTLWYQKARGSNRLYKKVIDDNGEFSPVALIKVLKVITEPLVRHASCQDRDKLFLGLTISCTTNEAIKSPNPSYIKYQMNQEGGWCDQYNLQDEHERPLRVSLKKWRVYYLTNRYKKTGQLAKVSRDAAHSMKKTTVGYIENESTKHLHEAAVESGIQSLLSIARPKVVVEETPQGAANFLGTGIVTAEKILKGDQDVFFASCADFYNRPGGQPNTPCDKPWGCFLCSNAIITRHVLPRVIAFRDFMVKEQGYLTTDDWNAKFGKVWHVITHDVLPKFSPDVIAEAERLAREQILYIPLAMRV